MQVTPNNNKRKQQTHKMHKNWQNRNKIALDKIMDYHQLSSIRLHSPYPELTHIYCIS